jgi:hypothetical protein
MLVLPLGMIGAYGMVMHIDGPHRVAHNIPPGGITEILYPLWVYWSRGGGLLWIPVRHQMVSQHGCCRQRCGAGTKVQSLVSLMVTVHTVNVLQRYRAEYCAGNQLGHTWARRRVVPALMCLHHRNACRMRRPIWLTRPPIPTLAAITP